MNAQAPKNVETDEIELGELSSSERAEYIEARKLLITCMIKALQANPNVARGITDNDRARMKQRVLSAPLPVLYRRIEAVGVQNPGALAQALQHCGYTVRPDGMGGYGIDPYADPTELAGQFVDYDEFMKELESDKPLD